MQKTRALERKYSRLDDYTHNTIKLAKYEQLGKMLVRLGNMGDNDNEDHVEYVMGTMIFWGKTIRRLNAIRTSDSGWK